jgi:hypothetical protein
VNQEVQEMKKGWNKKGDSNLSTGCPIAAFSVMDINFDVILFPKKDVLLRIFFIQFFL